MRAASWRVLLFSMPYKEGTAPNTWFWNDVECCPFAPGSLAKNRNFFPSYSIIYFLRILWKVPVWDFTREVPFLCLSEGPG